jgi:Holliday junction DNA helicase RuvA
MFWYISWDILAIDGISVTLQVIGTGLGLDVLVSPSVLSHLDQKEATNLWIHHHITEVSQLLFGFSTLEERSLFRSLNKVNGIWGKTALALLGLGEETLIRAIQMEDDKLLSSVPGIGKKTAQKIIVDLKWSIDFSKKSSVSDNKKSIRLGGPILGHSNTPLISSLVSMGYDKIRVESVVMSIDPDLSLEVRTVEAIRELSK